MTALAHTTVRLYLGCRFQGGMPLGLLGAGVVSKIESDGSAFLILGTASKAQHVYGVTGVEIRTW